MEIRPAFAFLLLLAIAVTNAKSAVVVLADNTTAARLNADLTIQELLLDGNQVALGFGNDCAKFRLGGFTSDYSVLKGELDNLSAAELGDVGRDVAGAWETLRPEFGERSVWLAAGKDDDCGGLDLALVKLRGYGVKINVIASEEYHFLSRDAKVADGFYGRPDQIKAAMGDGNSSIKCLPFFIIPTLLIAGAFA